MRLIDADALINDINVECRISGEDNANAVANAFNTIIQQIDNAPAIEIVRCKDCKWLRYCETEDLDFYLDCDHPDGGGIPRSEEWFCADGERSEP